MPRDSVLVMIRLVVEMPADEFAGDKKADEYSDLIVEAVQAIPGVADGSVTVDDWTGGA